jgi:hypothetical protein
VVACKAHNLEVGGSSPSPATKIKPMNISKALKHKKKLIKKSIEIFTRIRSNNTYDKGTLPAYDSRKLFEEWTALNTEIIDLKTKIHLANAPVYHKIFEMSELKGMVSYIKSIPTDSGIKRYLDETTETVAVIGTVEKDNMVAELEEKIDAIQDELEAFNSITQI